MSDELVQKTYTAVLKHMMQTGKAPYYTELAHILGVSPDEARDLLRSAAEAGVGCWLISDTDYVESWAPFYNAATNFQISVNNEQKWNGQ